MSKRGTLGLNVVVGVIVAAASAGMPAAAQQLGPENPFYAASTLPFQAPPFDKIKDTDYQPAFDAGMAEQLKEIQAIVENLSLIHI